MAGVSNNSVKKETTVYVLWLKEITVSKSLLKQNFFLLYWHKYFNNSSMSTNNFAVLTTCTYKEM